jgi:hypothetical protein
VLRLQLYIILTYQRTLKLHCQVDHTKYPFFTLNFQKSPCFKPLIARLIDTGVWKLKHLRENFVHSLIIKILENEVHILALLFLNMHITIVCSLKPASRHSPSDILTVVGEYFSSIQSDHLQFRTLLL